MSVYRIYDQTNDVYVPVVAPNRIAARDIYTRSFMPEVTEIVPLDADDDDVQRFPESDWALATRRGETALGYEEWLAEKLASDWRGL